MFRTFDTSHLGNAIAQTHTVTRQNHCGGRVYCFQDKATRRAVLVPSVTTVIKGLSLSGDKVFEGNAATRRGTRVHQWIQNLLEGVNHPIDYREGDWETDSPYLKSFQLGFVDRMRKGDVQIHGCEIFTSYFPHLDPGPYKCGPYAGRADAIGTVEGRPALIDFKTSANPPRSSKMAEHHILQAVAYVKGLQQTHGTQIRDAWIIGITPSAPASWTHKELDLDDWDRFRTRRDTFETALLAAQQRAAGG